MAQGNFTYSWDERVPVSVLELGLSRHCKSHEYEVNELKLLPRPGDTVDEVTVGGA